MLRCQRPNADPANHRQWRRECVHHLSTGFLSRVVVLALVVVAGAGLVAAAPTVGAGGTPPQLTAEGSATPTSFLSTRGFSNTTTTADTYLSVAANVTATVLNSSNTVVKTLLNGASESAGYFDPTWDGTNSSGSVVPNGSYTIQIVTENRRE